MRRVAAVSLMAALMARSAAGQVGSPPEHSPYVDAPFSGELTALGGWFSGNTGRAGVGPQSAPVAGGRFEWHLGGPMGLGLRFARAFSDRTVINPLVFSGRVLGTTSQPMYFFDTDLMLSLTGQKTWHKLMPIVQAGLGLTTDFGQDKDIGGYALGTSFALNFGVGVRWIPSRRWQLRLDATDNVFQQSYPNSYFTPPIDGGTPVLNPTEGQNEWNHSFMATLGISWLFRK